MPPKLIGPYRVLETLGSGGAGTVYRAIDKRNNDAVALKLLSNGPALDPKAARRLAREFETLATLSHPNVVRVYDTGVFQGYPYLAMELVEGLTLRPYLSVSAGTLGRLTPSSASGSHDDDGLVGKRGSAGGGRRQRGSGGLQRGPQAVLALLVPGRESQRAGQLRHRPGVAAQAGGDGGRAGHPGRGTPVPALRAARSGRAEAPQAAACVAGRGQQPRSGSPSSRT